MSNEELNNKVLRFSSEDDICTIELLKTLTNEEFLKVKNGYTPKSMDDHWRVIYDNYTVYFERSWSGKYVFEVDIIMKNNLYFIEKFRFNKLFKDTFFNSEEYIRNTLEFLIDSLLLDKKVNYKYPEEIKKKLSIKGDYLKLKKSECYLSKKVKSSDEKYNKILDSFLGHVVGDALGVPVEFFSREELESNPVNKMLQFGTHNQPIGSWSDDSSLTFCLAESLIDGYNLKNISKSFIRWYYEGFWTTNGKVFDIGNTTKKSIEKIKKGVTPFESGSADEFSNGNGSLMRILPLIVYLIDFKDVSRQIHIIHEVSALTHAHNISKIACSFYVFLGQYIYNGESIKSSYYKTIKLILNIYSGEKYTNDIMKFDRLFSGIEKLNIDEINSSGYVIDTLEAVVWCLLNTSSYKEAVLKAVNLGGDTDTIGAITGGLAGLFYGGENIPIEWYQKIIKFDEIVDLAKRFSKSLVK